MWQYYLMIIGSVICFSVQFVFTKCYQRERGANVFSTLIMVLIYSSLFVPMYFMIGGFKFEFTWYSLLIAGLLAINGITCDIFCIKVLSVANLSVYSIFLMLGGMLVPFFYGLIFFDEKLTVFRVFAVLFTIVALLSTFRKGEDNKKITPKAIFYFIMIFLTNGLGGTLIYIHQKSAYEVVSTSGFLLLSSINRFSLAGLIIICIVIFGKINAKKQPEPINNVVVDRKALMTSWAISIAAACGFALMQGTAQFMEACTAKYIDAGVQATILSGGCIFMSAIFGLFFKEKITVKTIICLVFALASVIFMIL